ncbi:GLPGLI family protein [Flavobacterium sp.]|uniref:GLPGLI family protein n=1 Tax=Flavobacterium sp. TaxID=239 RepID=UPI004047D8E1
MKKILYLLFLTTSFYAQINSGEVTYSLTIGYDEKLSNDERFGEMIKKAQEGAKQISSTLFFNKDVSLFKGDDMIENENSYLAKALSRASTVFYAKKDSLNKIRQINSSFGQFIVHYSKKTDWKLENETKYIDSYLCYKASAEVIVTNSKGTFNFPVTAWYCPTIPFNYGPLAYDGLPGLILELNERFITYGAIKVNLSKENSIIEKPNKGKVVTEEEFNEIVKKPPSY